MNLFAMCLNVIAKPDVIELYRTQLSLIPASIKTELLKILCKRGIIKDVFLLKQLVHSKVTEVDLGECFVKDDILSCLCVCKNLKKLDLSLRRRQTRSITSETLGSLFRDFSHLKFLAIPHCRELNDEVIQNICKSCQELKELFIPYSSISDLSLSFIGQNLSQLNAINLLGTQISDSGVNQLLNGPLANSLYEINIDNCPNITSYSTQMIVEKCKNIKIYSCGPCNDREEWALAMNGITKKAQQVFWSV